MWTCQGCGTRTDFYECTRCGKSKDWYPRIAREEELKRQLREIDAGASEAHAENVRQYENKRKAIKDKSDLKNKLLNDRKDFIKHWKEDSIIDPSLGHQYIREITEDDIPGLSKTCICCCFPLTMFFCMPCAMLCDRNTTMFTGNQLLKLLYCFPCYCSSYFDKKNYEFSDLRNSKWCWETEYCYKAQNQWEMDRVKQSIRNFENQSN